MMMRRYLLGCILCLFSSAGMNGSDNVRMTIELKDGTRIVGKPLQSHISVKTDYATLDIPFALLTRVVFGGDHETMTITLRNGDRIRGTTDLVEFRFESMVGTVSVARKDIVTLSALPDTEGLDMGLVAHYPFEGDANDISGHEIHGRVHAAGLTGNRFGIPGSAYLFDGSDCYIDLGADSTLNPRSSMTITAWIKTHGSGIRDIVSRWETQDHAEHERTYALGVRPDNTLYWIISPDGTHENLSLVSDGKPLPASSWNFVAATWDGSRMTLFKNGVSVGSTELPRMERSAHVRTSIGGTIGRQGDPAINCFQGAIGDVRIYSRSLSKQEIQSLYNAK